MKQISVRKGILFHLYPGIFITLAYIILQPPLQQHGYPPQTGILLSIVLVALPVFLIHLLNAKKEEQQTGLLAMNAFTTKLPPGRLVLHVLLLVVFAFLIWGITQPLSAWIGKHLLQWLPAWYTSQDFAGYAPAKIKQVLVLNLLLNGLLAPVMEELYFRGYLLPRMRVFGNRAFMVNTALFALYHFWQPYVYLTLFISLLPMVWFTQKTRDLRVAMYTHVSLNLIGAIAFYASLGR